MGGEGWVQAAGAPLGGDAEAEGCVASDAGCIHCRRRPIHLAALAKQC